MSIVRRLQGTRAQRGWKRKGELGKSRRGSCQSQRRGSACTRRSPRRRCRPRGRRDAFQTPWPLQKIVQLLVRQGSTTFSNPQPLHVPVLELPPLRLPTDDADEQAVAAPCSGSAPPPPAQGGGAADGGGGTQNRHCVVDVVPHRAHTRGPAAASNAALCAGVSITNRPPLLRGRTARRSIAGRVCGGRGEGWRGGSGTPAAVVLARYSAERWWVGRKDNGGNIRGDTIKWARGRSRRWWR